MGKILYDFICVHTAALTEAVRELNQCQDKIVAVTQLGNTYTIFYESRGNEKGGEG